MKLNKFFIVAGLGLAAVACSNAPEVAVEAKDEKEVEVAEVVASEYVVAADANTVNWTGFKTYSDGSHSGTINVSEGKFMAEGDQLIGGEFTIDMNSIQCIDLAENKEYHDKLVGHLRSGDFFLVDSFQTATFVITDLVAAEDAEAGTTHNVSGNLTLRGVTKNISFPASVMTTEGMIEFNAPEFVINRTDWGVNFHATSLAGAAKDQLIDDNIKLSMNLKAAKA